MEEKKAGKILIIILILFVLILIIGMGYLVFQNMELIKKQNQGEAQLQTLQNKMQELEKQTNTEKGVTEENAVTQTEQNTIQSNMTNSITKENVTNQTQQTPQNTTSTTTTTKKDDLNYVGTYKNSSGEIAIISKKSDGYYVNLNNNNFKINMNEKKNDGSIVIYDSKDEFDRWFVYLYPVGVNLKLAENEGDEVSNYKTTDSSKIRLLLNGSSQEFLSDVLYKIN